ncbi:MAG: thioredoxin family protein [Myxococcales bacterium]|nr:thioredoxin family protein [Myxococcales bacterium]
MTRHRPFLRHRLASLAALSVTALLVSSTARADMLHDIARPFQSALEGGHYGPALGMIFIAGLVTSLTPCVYPMIAITVSVFGARQAKTRIEGAMLSVAFILGMAALFTPLGVIATLTGHAMGSELSNPFVLAGLGLLFGAMALSMFGLFDLNLPAGLRNRLAQVGGTGYRGAFLLGFASGLIAAPCTGPVLAVLLTWVGTTQSVAFGALSLFVYSLGLGVLFFFVGTFAMSLPKSGRWLASVKSAFGVVMLALALYYVMPILPIALPAQRTTAWIAGAAVALVLGLALGAIHLSFTDASTGRRVRKGLGVALATGGLVAAIFWVVALPAGARIAWHEDYAAARAQAHSQNKPLLVDFGADWCGACKELDHDTLSDPRVVAESRRFVAVRVDLSAGQDTPQKWALLRDYKQPGLPLVVLHDASGAEVGRVTGPIATPQFLSLMRAAAD